MGFEALAEAARTYDKTSIGEKMTGVNIEFNIQDALDAMLHIEAAIDDMSGLFEHMGEVLLDIHEARFLMPKNHQTVYLGKHYHRGIKKVSQSKKIKF